MVRDRWMLLHESHRYLYIEPPPLLYLTRSLNGRDVLLFEHGRIFSVLKPEKTSFR